MTLPDFFRALLRHVSLAAVSLAAILLVAEKFVPGSVLPFVNVIDALPIIIGLVIATVLSTKKEP